MAALTDTRMPGVITQEIPTLPPSIALVPSAVPVFIGYTEKAEKNGEDLTLKATRIRNMREYEDWFGTAPYQEIEVDIDDRSEAGEGIIAKVVKVKPEKFKFKMYYALRLYYANGGGPCYIVSINPYQNGTIDKVDFENGIKAAKKTKDITIILFPDATGLSDEQYNEVVILALDQCNLVKNRVTLIDVKDEQDNNSSITNFRTKITSDPEKKYGIAYYPFLDTTQSFRFSDESVSVGRHLINGNGANAALLEALIAAQKEYRGAEKSNINLKLASEFYIKINEYIIGLSGTPDIQIIKSQIDTIRDSNEYKDIPPEALKLNDFKDKLSEAPVTLEGIKKKATAQKESAESTYHKAMEPAENKVKEAKAMLPGNLSGSKNIKELANKNNLVYNKIKEAINNYPVPMPPSAAIAGLYVAVDASQGPWRAPANFSLAGVIQPTVEIDDDLHADLNSDSNSGKSINAIRSYVGKGVLVFGARTLAGNDLEWRYVNVRRTFCFIEDSVARAMQDFVFAPNTRDTWIKVKAMIGNFLIGIWQAGGLFGNTADEAYQVSVGLPETMTDVDILEGRMIVQIKLRVSRPAEFIILRYEHKFQATGN